MISVKDRGILEVIIEHCQRIESKTNGLTKEEFIENEDIKDIVCFNILQIGELAKNFSEELISKYKTVPWKQIKGMRDKIGHGYGTIDLDKVWNTASTDIHPLKIYCENILNK